MHLLFWDPSADFQSDSGLDFDWLQHHYVFFFIFSYSAVDMLLRLLSLSCWMNHALAVRQMGLHLTPYFGIQRGSWWAQWVLRCPGPVAKQAQAHYHARKLIWGVCANILWVVFIAKHGIVHYYLSKRHCSIGLVSRGPGGLYRNSTQVLNRLRQRQRKC